MKIVSLDLSLTATGWCVSDNGVVTWGVFSQPGLRGLPRIDWIARQIADVTRGADAVVMEDFAFSQGNSFAREIAGLTFMVRHFLWKRETDYFLVAPTSLKKFIVGHSGSKKTPVPKSAIVKEVFKRWGHDTFDDNAADAIGLAYIGRALGNDWEPTIEPQREVIAMLRKKGSCSGS